MKHIEAKEFKNYIKFINSSNYEELLETSQNIKSRKTENNLHFKDFFVGIFVLVIGL
ncbi:MAG: hypothetical protein LBD88_03190 [Candidatus Peribacteria bacterium]|jgi:hypothetical protein|nr:hypothetical protein [Candidatus Peribacteria bacterium]